ncbi:tRNA pseudouridine(55) synthase TruB [Clostridium chrysemydis]|uniref:tRNA pseudouridine(55) synthase TruB n=1 Tax=Clostridium chrysemydis TaxID=2665504 RepID=UPI00188466EE|nr:tRNA pseudouridine(55) synthase TruB [Clostridium chrysemydis]
MQGIINIFKNKGMTSFDVVRIVKRLAKTKKVGHTGTLDPEACGVLPVAIGKATKIIDYIMDSDKVYEVSFMLGEVRDTYDLEGKIISQKDTSHLKKQDVLEGIKKFTGEYMQVPPMYSALKQNGVRLYDLARQGIEVERKGRKVNIKCIDNIEIKMPYVKMRVCCTKGTYIRSLCFDIGEYLNVGAVMTDLKRTKTSVFDEENSINIADLTEENIFNYVISIDDALSKYPKLTVKNKYAKLLQNGVNVFDTRLTSEEVQENQLYRVYNEEDLFLGLGEKGKKGFKLQKLLV